MESWRQRATARLTVPSLRMMAYGDALLPLECGHEYSRISDRIGDSGGGSGVGCGAGPKIRITPPLLWVGDGSSVYVPEDAGYDTLKAGWFQPE
jgi:hypothetical protein